MAAGWAHDVARASGCGPSNITRLIENCATAPVLLALWTVDPCRQARRLHPGEAEPEASSGLANPSGVLRVVSPPPPRLHRPCGALHLEGKWAHDSTHEAPVHGSAACGVGGVSQGGGAPVGGGAPRGAAVGGGRQTGAGVSRYAPLSSAWVA